MITLWTFSMLVGTIDLSNPDSKLRILDPDLNPCYWKVSKQQDFGPVFCIRQATFEQFCFLSNFSIVLNLDFFSFLWLLRVLVFVFHSNGLDHLRNDSVETSCHYILAQFKHNLLVILHVLLWRFHGETSLLLSQRILMCKYLQRFC